MAESYMQKCPVAYALDVVGERWTLLIIRDLFRHGPLRFQQFELRLPGIAPSTLSTRIRFLEEKGIVESRLYETHPPRPEYFLTESGRALGPVLKALFNWGEKFGGQMDKQVTKR